MAADPLNEMRDAVRQKQSGCELQQENIPGNAEHPGSPLFAGINA